MQAQDWHVAAVWGVIFTAIAVWECLSLKAGGWIALIAGLACCVVSGICYIAAIELYRDYQQEVRNDEEDSSRHKTKLV